MLDTTHALTESLRTYLTAPIQAGRDILVVCIGTDRSTGDSFGPYDYHTLQSARLGLVSHMASQLADRKSVV